MAYFLRFTETAKADLDRNSSFHASGISENDITIEDAASMFDCDEDEIILLDYGIYSNNKENGDLCYFQKLDGLCGFELEVDNLEDAIEEAEDFNFNSVYNTSNMVNFSIFEGDYAGDCPEGAVFNAENILYTK